MYITYGMLASKYHCSEATIRRRVAEMENSNLFPMAIRRVKGVEVDDEDFERFCCMRRKK